jgi:hypothetical protein
MKSLVLSAMLLGAVFAGSVRADDDDDDNNNGRIPPEARTHVEQVLSSLGCKPGKIETDDGGFEVENAECADGRHKIKLDEDFKVTSRHKGSENEE